MARPHETFNKKNREKKKQQKRQEKAEARSKANARGKLSMDDMIAYVDENGNISSTPPDPTKKKEIAAESIEVSVPPSVSIPQDTQRTGKVKFFNDSKGFGFIEDSQSGESLFVHVNDLAQPIREGDKVTFKTKRGPKGFNAVEVELI